MYFTNLVTYFHHFEINYTKSPIIYLITIRRYLIIPPSTCLTNPAQLTNRRTPSRQDTPTPHTPPASTELDMGWNRLTCSCCCPYVLVQGTLRVLCVWKSPPAAAASLPLR